MLYNLYCHAKQSRASSWGSDSVPHFQTQSHTQPLYYRNLGTAASQGQVLDFGKLESMHPICNGLLLV